jgi:hypothetical protein
LLEPAAQPCPAFALATARCLRTHSLAERCARLAPAWLAAPALPVRGSAEQAPMLSVVLDLLVARLQERAQPARASRERTGLPAEAR